LHRSTIDTDALRASFPVSRLGEVEVPTPPRARNPNAPTPVFVISHNSADRLRRCIAGARTLKRATEIIVHDNGSTEVATVALLAELERSGTQIARNKGVTDPAETIRAYFTSWSEPARYVVSDCDVDVSVGRDDMIDVFDDLLNRHRTIDAVGPVLRAQVAGGPGASRLTRTNAGEVPVFEGSVETGFALHRAGELFRRSKRALRVGEPYHALRLGA